MRRIALTRAREEAERTAARLAERGFAAVIAPVIESHATGAAVPPGPFAAVVATSAKALDALSEKSREAIAGAPLYVVGSRGAEAAARRGLALAAPHAVDVAALAAELVPRLAPGSRALYLAGEHRKSALERVLGAAGRRVVTVEVYAARARNGWTAIEAAAVADCDAALHYSRRGAELAIRLAEAAAIADRFRALSHVCISPDAAEPLRAWGAARLAAAASPNEDALFAALTVADGVAERVDRI